MSKRNGYHHNFLQVCRRTVHGRHSQSTPRHTAGLCTHNVLGAFANAVAKSQKYYPSSRLRSYWWSRFGGLLGRFVRVIFERDWIFMLIYVDNLLQQLGTGIVGCLCGERLSVSRCWECRLRTNMFARGLVIDYVGFASDYTRFSMPSYTVGYTSYVKLNKWSVVVRFSFPFLP